ncbi:MAG TPA: tetratricopeptide repeat protein [Terriglobales bacterium]|nr:tetratricopeptide repeat protein [Terriglobales bacterium]
MGLYHIFGYWTYILQAIAIVHFIRRRPNAFWLWIILIGGGLGALVYFIMEVVPDLGLLKGSFKFFERRQKIASLEDIIQQNPSAGNYEELADLHLENKNYQRALDCYNHAISSRTDSLDPFYRRGICEVELGDFTNAIPDLERVVQKDPKYDFLRAQGLLAHAYAKTSQPDRAAAIFPKVLETSTISETMYNYAQFLLAQGRKAEARDWAQRILSKRAAMPGYLKRRERPWFRKANSIIKQAT